MTIVALALVAAASVPASGDARSSAVVQAAPAIVPSPEAGRVADWIGAAADNHGLPYLIVDKRNAAIFLFDAGGVLLGAAPVLVGIAPGDEATPGIGGKSLAEIGPAEKTTPAGRFLARYGLAVGREKVLWVDYATSVAIHTIPRTAAQAEQRRERMLSPEADDNRITFGCINVPIAFEKTLRPRFRRKGGYVYVLPDTKPIEDVFPRLRVQALVNGRGS